MFARWRNLAAAAGALCFPFSLVQASLHSDELHCTRSTPSARQQATTEESWFRNERNSWYSAITVVHSTMAHQLTTHRFYRLTIPSNPPISQLSSSRTSEPINESADDRTANIEECDDPTCPCHDIMNPQEDEEKSNGAPANGTTAPNLDIESESRRICDTYVPRDENDHFPSKSEPTAELSGTINPSSSLAAIGSRITSRPSF